MKKYLIIPFAISLNILANDSVAAQFDGLPTTKRVERFFDIVEKLDLTAAKVGDGNGGISVDLAYEANVEDRKVIGNFLSRNRRDKKGDNGTGNPEGHIVSFNLARVLGVSDIYSTGVWYQIKDSVVESLHQIAVSAKGRGSARLENRNRVLQNTTASNGVYPAIYGSLSVYLEKKWTVVQVAGSPLERPNLSPNGVANESNPLIQIIMGRRPMPQEHEMIKVQTEKGGVVSINALQAAKDLSAIFLIDAIMEQGDRFSGSNFDLLKMPDGSFRIASLDNGAAGVPGYFTSYTTKYLKWIHFVDHTVLEQLLELDRFLQKGGKFLGFTNQAQFLEALGLRLFQKSFVRNVHRAATQLR